MNYHNNENQTDNNNNEDDDDDLVKLETEMQEEELIFEKMQDVDLEAQEEEPEFWPLRIKSIRDIRIQVRPTDSIGEVKQAVLEGLQKCDETVSASGSHHYVRLVCRGRLLAPDSAPLNTCGVLIQPNDVIHAVLTKQQQQQSSASARGGRRQGGVQAALQQGSTQRLSRRALRSAGINTDGLAVRRTATEDQEDEDEDDESVSSQEDFSSGGASRNNNNNRNYNSFLQRRGFDRLRSLGLRRGEIHALRSYFSRHVDRFVQQREQDGESPERTSTTTEDTITDDEENHPEASSDPLMRRRLQEEAWMQSQGPLSEFRLNLPSGGGLALMSLLRSNRNTGGAENNGNNNNPWLSTANTNTAGNNNNATTTTTNTANTSRQQQGAERDAEFLCGFLLGFFVGPMMLIWVWLPTVPHRQKFGILTGITVQLAVTALGLAPQPPDTTTNPAEDGSSIETDGTFLELAGWRYGGYGQLLAEQQQQQLQEVTDDQVILG